MDLEVRFAGFAGWKTRTDSADSAVDQNTEPVSLGSLTSQVYVNLEKPRFDPQNISWKMQG